MYQDLHTHTTLSDGMMSYGEALDICAQNNISVIAFTDHDLVPGKNELGRLDKLRNHPTRWILGVEMSSDPPKEMEGVEVPQLHIVGLFVDPKNKALIKQGKVIVQARLTRLKKLVKNVRRLGFDLTEKDCLAESRGEVVQRPHVVLALLKKEKNVEIVKNLIVKMKKEAGKNKNIAQQYNEAVKQGKANPDNPYFQFVFKLFLSEDSFIKGIYVRKGGLLDFDANVSLIRNAGGIAILAHWSEYRHKFPIEMVEKVFRQKRIDGAEIVYDLYRIGLGEEKELRQEQKKIRDLVEKYSLLASGGSDAHRKESLVRFAQTKWFAKQTIGLAEKMMRGKGLCRNWATLQKG